LEEQALARIHRLGQTQPVTTVRFYVRDSFEEVSKRTHARCSTRDYFFRCGRARLILLDLQRVVELQEKKRRLAGVLLEPRDQAADSQDVGYFHVRLVLLVRIRRSPNEHLVSEISVVRTDLKRGGLP
jgi:hypothetical protein